MAAIKYIREGKGTCRKCSKEQVDVVVKHVQVPSFYEKWVQEEDFMIARHLRRIEEYTPKGAKPGGFCEGSFGEPALAKPPAREHGKGKR